jgi:exodeoxyribonuclease VII large subunit
MFFAVRDRLRGESRHLGAVRQRLHLQAEHLVDAASSLLETTRRLLGAYDPQRRLSQGWSIVTDARGSLVRSIDAVHVGDVLQIRVSDGSLQSTINAKDGTTR